MCAFELSGDATTNYLRTHSELFHNFRRTNPFFGLHTAARHWRCDLAQIVTPGRQHWLGPSDVVMKYRRRRQISIETEETVLIWFQKPAEQVAIDVEAVFAEDFNTAIANADGLVSQARGSLPAADEETERE